MAKCGAKTRAGTPCARPAMANGRCNLHGGKTPKGQRNALKHGIYAKALNEEEKGIWSEITLGDVDDELRMLRVQLRRCWIKIREIEEGPHDESGLEISQISTATDQSGDDGENPPPIAHRTYKQPDYRVIADRILSRIATLEKHRMEVHQVTGQSAGDLAEKIRSALREADATIGDGG